MQSDPVERQARAGVPARGAPLRMPAVTAEPRFAKRGMSRRTIEALVASGMDSPERLLFLDEAAIKNIPGIGTVALAEIRTYRGRFAIPAAATPP